MNVSINEYASFLDSRKTRILLYPNVSAAGEIIQSHKQYGDSVITISDCLKQNASNLPPPHELIKLLIQVMELEPIRYVVLGLDAYLALWSDKQALYRALFRAVDTNQMNVVFLLHIQHDIHSLFANPRYRDAQQIVVLEGEASPLPLPRISITSQSWLIDSIKTHNSFRSLLLALGDLLDGGESEHYLALPDYQHRLPGLADNVRQIDTLKEAGSYFYGLDSSLSEEMVARLIEAGKERQQPPQDYLKTLLGVNPADFHSAVKRLYEIEDDLLWQGFAWLVRKEAPAFTYTSQVLEQVAKKADLLNCVVVSAALVCCVEVGGAGFAQERAQLIDSIGHAAKTYIPAFIEKAKKIPDQNVLPFLNCGTENEIREIIRRVSQCDLIYGIPNMYLDVLPMLDDYLARGFDMGDTLLTSYFSEYRRLKLQDCVTTDFVQRAYEIEHPRDIPSRDALLQHLQRDENLGLLVVDGMGAEFLPLLHSLAKQFSLQVESSTVATVQLPTTTEFNPIQWPQERLIEVIKTIDNTAHDTETKYENAPFQDNIAVVLQTMREKVFEHILEGLTKYSRVVLTADHGTSRLAVIAHNQGLSRTLQLDGVFPDWRYTAELTGQQKPAEMEGVYRADRNATYWVVKGYHRLSKSGSKLNELHGGATLEERLVPVVVFSMSVSKQPQPTKKKKEPLVVERRYNIP